MKNKALKRKIQRCVSISTNHEFEHLTKPGFYFDLGGKKIEQDQWVYVGGKNIFKCLYCGLIDDMFEGKYS